jgi:hypothetical protein
MLFYLRREKFIGLRTPHPSQTAAVHTSFRIRIDSGPPQHSGEALGAFALPLGPALFFGP